VIGIIGDARRDGKSSFSDLMRYCEKDGRAEYVGMQNIHFKDSMAEEMESLAFQNSRCKDPLMHIILSWREMELPSNAQVDEAVKIALEELGLQNCQAAWFVHADTENRHVHIAVNRIDPETYKAIQPADNWTHKAIQRAGRKIEIAQGWELEQHGSYFVTQEGTIVEKTRQESEKPKLSKPALDIEAHTAAKSAERIGQEVAAPLIQDSKSWEELHLRLAEEGIRYERKGSGAVLVIGETAIKASIAGRDLTLAKLEQRLGAFAPGAERSSSVPFRDRPPEPVKRASGPKVKNKWTEFISLRTEYFKSKKSAEKDLKDRHRQEWSEMSKRQANERKRAFSGSWKGRGSDLNRIRSVTASTQKAEKLYLRDKQAEERSNLKKRYSARFPTFKSWLDLDENSPELSILYRYPNDPMLYSPFDSSFEKRTLIMEDLRNFEARRGTKGSVVYVRAGAGSANIADFVDYGKKILVSEKYDKKTILAALQLAQQKWGAVNISGDERYKKMCLEVASSSKEAIRIFIEGKEAPKVQETIDVKAESTERAHIPWKATAELVSEKQEDFRRYVAAVGAEEYRVTLINRLGEGNKAYVWGKGKGESTGRHSGEKILQDMESLVREGEKGFSITVTPLGKKTHHILVDDMTAESLAHLRADGYKPACIIESSPGNFQAVLNVPKFAPDDPNERTRANLLTRELNRAYGDKNLSGAEHAHRMPGFPNCKPKHRRADGTFPESVLLEAEGGICEKAVARLTEIRREDLRRAEQEKERRKEMAAYGSLIPGSTIDAYWKHCDDILSHHGDPDDYSKLDGMIALRLKVTGHSQSSIQDAIENCAPQVRKQFFSDGAYREKYGARNWKDYAQRTVDYAFGGKAARQEERLLGFLKTLLKIEGQAVGKAKTQTAQVPETPNTSRMNDSSDRMKFTPKIGDRVVFYLKNKSSAGQQTFIAGKVVDMDNVKGTVTIDKEGEKFTVFRGKGYFKPAQEAPQQQENWVSQRPRPDKSQSMER
jgi:hypothetical protein